MEILRPKKLGSLFDPENGSDVSLEIILSRHPIEDAEFATKEYVADRYKEEMDKIGDLDLQGTPVKLEGPDIVVNEDNDTMNIRGDSSMDGNEFIYASADAKGRVVSTSRDLKGSEVEGGLDITIEERDTIDPKSPITDRNKIISHIQERLTSENLGIIDGYPLKDPKDETIKLDRLIQFPDYAELEVDEDPVLLKPTFLSNQISSVFEQVFYRGVSEAPGFGKVTCLIDGFLGVDPVQKDYNPAHFLKLDGKTIPKTVDAARLKKVLEEQGITLNQNKLPDLTNLTAKWQADHGIVAVPVVSIFDPVVSDSHGFLGKFDKSKYNPGDTYNESPYFPNLNTEGMEEYAENHIWVKGTNKNPDSLRRGTLKTKWVQENGKKGYFKVDIPLLSYADDICPLDEKVISAISIGVDGTVLTTEGIVAPMIARLSEVGGLPEDFYGDLTSPEGLIYTGVKNGEAIPYVKGSTPTTPHIFDITYDLEKISYYIRVPSLETMNPEYWAFYFQFRGVSHRQIVMLNPRWYDGGFSLLPPKLYCSEIYDGKPNELTEILGGTNDHPFIVSLYRDWRHTGESNDTSGYVSEPGQSKLVFKLGYITNPSQDIIRTERGSFIFGEYELWFTDVSGKTIDLHLKQPDVEFYPLFGGTQWFLTFELDHIQDREFRVVINNLVISGTFEIKAGAPYRQHDITEIMELDTRGTESFNAEVTNAPYRSKIWTVWNIQSLSSNSSNRIGIIPTVRDGQGRFYYTPGISAQTVGTGTGQDSSLTSVLSDSAWTPRNMELVVLENPYIPIKASLEKQAYVESNQSYGFDWETLKKDTLIPVGKEGYCVVIHPTLMNISLFYKRNPDGGWIADTLLSPLTLDYETIGANGVKDLLPSFKRQGRKLSGEVHMDFESTVIPEGIAINGDDFHYAIEKMLPYGKQKDSDGNWINIGEVPFTGKFIPHVQQNLYDDKETLLRGEFVLDDEGHVLVGEEVFWVSDELGRRANFYFQNPGIDDPRIILNDLPSGGGFHLRRGPDYLGQVVFPLHMTGTKYHEDNHYYLANRTRTYNGKVVTTRRGVNVPIVFVDSREHSWDYDLGYVEQIYAISIDTKEVTILKPKRDLETDYDAVTHRRVPHPWDYYIECAVPVFWDYIAEVDAREDEGQVYYLTKEYPNSIFLVVLEKGTVFTIVGSDVTGQSNRVTQLTPHNYRTEYTGPANAIYSANRELKEQSEKNNYRNIFISYKSSRLFIEEEPGRYIPQDVLRITSNPMYPGHITSLEYSSKLYSSGEKAPSNFRINNDYSTMVGNRSSNLLSNAEANVGPAFQSHTTKYFRTWKYKWLDPTFSKDSWVINSTARFRRYKYYFQFNHSFAIRKDVTVAARTLDHNEFEILPILLSRPSSIDLINLGRPSYYFHVKPLPVNADEGDIVDTPLLGELKRF